MDILNLHKPAPTNVKMALTSSSPAVTVNMLIIPSRVAATVDSENPPKCMAVIEKGPPHVMAESVIVHRIPRPHVPGRDPRRTGGTIGATDIIERAKTQDNGTSKKNRRRISVFSKRELSHLSDELRI